MITIKTRPNDNEGLDIVFLGLNREQTIAVREAFSDLQVNRDYAYEHRGEILGALRGHDEIREYHEWYKENIRDVHEVEPDDEYDDEEGEVDEFDSWD